MEVLETYRGYRIFKPRDNGPKNRRIFVDGSGISCNQYWYKVKNARSCIDFVLKVKQGLI